MVNVKSKQKRKMKELLWKQKGFTTIGKCCYCPKLITFNRATLEHKVRRADGGSNSISNLDLSCKPCNNKRGSEDEAKITVGRVVTFKKRLRVLRIEESIAILESEVSIPIYLLKVSS